MIDLSDAIERGDDAHRVLDNFGIAGGPERQTMERVIADMRALHHENRNHVWAYYLRNMTRPMVISEGKVDAIIGNPPWLTYNQSADIIREELNSLSENRYRIWAGGPNSHRTQDVATLFYCRAAELYLKENGRIGMVLPHSVLRTGQHFKFRSAYYESKRPPRSRVPKQAMSLDFTANAPLGFGEPESQRLLPHHQLCSVRPDARLPRRFRLSTSRPPGPSPQGQVEIWSGPTGSPHVSRSVVTDLIHDDGTFRSPYETRVANEGPSIT